ncbi:MAG: CHAT domain-containing tetratricopeptide repeat protein [Pseudomonadota bacterium]
MRVFSGQQRTWLTILCACIVAGLGSAAPARASTSETVSLALNTPLDMELADLDRVTLRLPAFDGYLVLEVEARFVAVELVVNESGREVTLTKAVDLPVLWLYESDTATPTRVELRVRQRRASAPRVRIVARSAPADQLGALATEASLSRLNRATDDDAMRRAARVALNASTQWQTVGEPTAAARTLVAAATFFRRAGEYTVAREHALAASKLYEEVDDRYGIGLAQNMVGLVSTDLGDFETGRRALERAQDGIATRYDGFAPNPATANLCLLLLNDRKLDEAEACYTGIIAQARELGADLAILRYETSLAGVYQRRGDMVRASKILRRLINEHEAPSKGILARWLNNYALYLKQLGQHQEALNHYQRALQIARDLGNRDQIDTITNNMAVVYGDLGAPHQAIEFLAEVYESRKQLGNRQAVLAMQNYAGALSMLGRDDEARDIFAEAIALAQRNKDTEGLSAAQRLAAESALNRNDLPEALKLATAAVKHADALEDAAQFRARAWTALGRVQTAANDRRTAARSLVQALSLWRETGNPYGVVPAQTDLGWAKRDAGDNEAALSLALEAVASIEQLRTEIASTDLRAAYQASVTRAYELAIHALMDMGDNIAALEMTERYRAKSLVDAWSQGRPEREVDVPANLLAERANALAAINNARTAHLRGEEEPPINALLAKLDVINDRIADAAPGANDSRAPDPLKMTEMQRLHEPGDVTLLYFLGDQAGYVWAIDAEDTAVARLDNVDDIDRLARQLHKQIQRRGRYEVLARELGKQVLAPISKQIETARNVAIVADGALHYVPFDILSVADNAPPALGTTPLVYLPSLTTVALSRSLPAPKGKGVAVLADPVFGLNDDRFEDGPITRSADRVLNRLRMSRVEAESIAAQAQGIDVKVHLGFDARPAVLRSPDVAGARILHIATHGFADDEIPARSGLALSMIDANGKPTTGFVGLRDIYGLQLDAELVVLSACETALGQDLAGEGLLGLTRGFMFAGARRVVATLWRVEDRATAELMTVFYSELFQGTAPTRALLVAKQTLRSDRRYKHPYYWSGFTLQGD